MDDPNKLDHRLIRIKVRSLFFVLPVKPVAGGESNARMWAANESYFNSSRGRLPSDLKNAFQITSVFLKVWVKRGAFDFL
jgi:hypothetical protein